METVLQTHSKYKIGKGDASCHHAGGLLIYAMDILSKTSGEYKFLICKNYRPYEP